MTWLWILSLQLASLAVFLDMADRAPVLDWQD